MNEIVARMLSSRPALLLRRPRAHRTLALVLLVAIALGSWLVDGARRPVTLLFPRASDGHLIGELRALRSERTEAGVQDLLSEMLLGPANPELQPLFAPGSRMRSVLLRKGVLYADFDEGVLAEGGAPLRLALAGAERTLRLGTPGLRRVAITIAGTAPFDTGPAALPQKK
jgi:hypothetical protein